MQPFFSIISLLLLAQVIIFKDNIMILTQNKFSNHYAKSMDLWPSTITFVNICDTWLHDSIVKWDLSLWPRWIQLYWHGGTSQKNNFKNILKKRFGDKFVWNILSKVPIDVISRQIHCRTFTLKDFEEKSSTTITTCWCDHLRHSQSDESDSIIGVSHKCPFQLCKYGDQWHWKWFNFFTFLSHKPTP